MMRVLIVMALGAAAMGQEWRPAGAPLMTRWGAAVDPARVLPEHPRPRMVRPDWLSLNGLWQFAPAAEGEAAPVGRPLDRRILVPFPIESALSGVGERHERAWYRRAFEVPAGWRTGSGERVLLHFGAVDWECRVFVNGAPIGGHRGGYDPFTFDITAALKSEGEQELIVGVFDPTDGGAQPRGKQVREPGGIWYTPTTGIWQTVWLERVPALRIERLRAEPDPGAESVKISVGLAGVYDGPSPVVRARVSAEGRIVAEGTGEDGVVIAIPGARPWSPDDPFLYGLRVSLEVGGAELDAVESYFGMRQISLGHDRAGTTRIMLNGAPVFGVGVLDQGFWPDGLYTAPSDEALRFDLEEAKRLGFNTVRKHVKVEPARWYYHADRLGLLVWQDMPSGDGFIGPADADLARSPESAAQFEAELAAMVEHLRGHPSIIMWVPFNEGWGQYDTARITELVRTLDPTRLVNSASGWTDRGTGDVHDVHVYPGPGAPAREAARASVLGEFGGLGLGVVGHTWAKESWGYRGVGDADALADGYEALLRRCYQLRDRAGLSAVIYTQLTDVETECNGLLTYDRAVVKADAARLAAANRGEFPALAMIAPTAQAAPVEWMYTFDDPGPGWMNEGAVGGSWRRGPAGFGTEGTPGAVVRTVWDSARIWVRREFELSERPRRARLLVHHDEDAEVYLNGVLAARLAGYTTGYELARIAPEAQAALRPGVNTIAITCTQTRGGQYIDAGLVEEIPGPGGPE